MNMCLKSYKYVSFIRFTLNLEVETKDKQYISFEVQFVGIKDVFKRLQKYEIDIIYDK